jgi:branched-chain amino acid transport system substrate-binding protein
MRKMLTLSLGLAATLLLVACSKTSDTVKIGVAAPLSGDQAHLGKDVENGARLAVDEANAAGVTIGGKKVKFELIAEDDQHDPKTATLVAQRLVDAKVVAVIGHMNSGAGIPASKIYSEAGIPQISPSMTAVTYTNQGFKNTFRLMANDGQQGKVLGEYAAKNLNAKSIVVIDDRTAYGQGLADEVAKAAEAAGAKVAAREYTNDKSTDFTAILTSAKGKSPDVIFYGGMDAQGGPMAKQLKSLGITAKFLGGDGLQSPEFIKLAGDAAEGAEGSSPGLPLDKMPGGTGFGDKYKAKFKVDVQIYAPYAYDATSVLIDAIKRADSTDPAKILAELPKTNFTGVTGPVAFDEKGDLKNGPVTVYQAKGKAWAPVITVGGNTTVAEKK